MASGQSIASGQGGLGLAPSLAGGVPHRVRVPVSNWAPMAFISWAVLAAAVSACGSSGGNANDAGGTGGAGGSSGLFPTACTKQVVPKDGTTSFVVGDFATSSDDTSVSWGFGSDTTFSGYSFRYPDAIVSDMSADNWHLTGMVSTYSGFALGFSCAVDASMFTGISFSVKGDAGATGRLVMSVGTSPDDVNMATAAPSWGKCVPKTNQYDGTCQSPKVDVPVTTTVNTFKVKWADLKGGAPQASVTAASLSGIVWTFDWIDGATPFPVDVTLDDVVFTVD
jgi:hypothetical protein